MIPLETTPITPGRSTDITCNPGEQVPGKFRHIELEINTACDLTCFACDRFSDVVTTPAMRIEQVCLFVRESLEAGWEWDRIRLLGGEPTLHPKFKECCIALMAYRRAYPKCFLQVLSNGRGKLADYRDWLLDRGIDPHVESKDPGVTPQWFVNTRITPLDRDPNIGAVPPCGIFGVQGCGIGLTRHGYFLDGAGAAIARIAGYDIGVMRLRDVTWESMLEQAKVLCRVCGHWNPDGTLITKKVTETGEVTGKFWTEALAKYNSKGYRAPPMRIYGE
jgi:hypothetical protein